MNKSLLIVIFFVCANLPSSVLAAPMTYQITSGPLTGMFTVDFLTAHAGFSDWDLNVTALTVGFQDPITPPGGGSFCTGDTNCDLDDKSVVGGDTYRIALNVSTFQGGNNYNYNLFKNGIYVGDGNEAGNFAPVPAPSAMLLMGSGLLGLVAWRYRKGVKV